MTIEDLAGHVKRAVDIASPGVTHADRLRSTLDTFRVGQPITVIINASRAGLSGYEVSRFATGLQSVADAAGPGLQPLAAAVAEDGSRVLGFLGQVPRTGNVIGKIVTHSKALSGVGSFLGCVKSGWDQWASDADRADIAPRTRKGRAAYRAAVKTGGGWVGGMGGRALGVYWGSVIGTAILPGPGTAIGLALGGLLGGIGGGMAGSALSDMAVDHSIERLLGAA